MPQQSNDKALYCVSVHDVSGSMGEAIDPLFVTVLYDTEVAVSDIVERINKKLFNYYEHDDVFAVYNPVTKIDIEQKPMEDNKTYVYIDTNEFVDFVFDHVAAE